MKKSNIIRTTHTAISYRFPRGNPAIVARPFSADRLSPRLAKLYAKIHKGGKVGVPVKKLDRDERWAARQLVEVGALRVVPESKEQKSAPKKASAKKPTGPFPTGRKRPAVSREGVAAREYDNETR